MTLSVFQQHLNQLRKDIFDAAFDIDVCAFGTVNQLADKAGLCWTTVNNLRVGDTKEPRYSTIFRLARAVKMDLKLVSEVLEAAESSRAKATVRKHRRAATR